MKTRICQECGRVFETPYPTQKYCGDECKGEANRKRFRRWYQKHKDEHNEEKRRRYREAHRAEETVTELKKPKDCPFGGSCFECPYPDCIAEQEGDDGD